jgi:hypothetical protein
MVTNQVENDAIALLRRRQSGVIVRVIDGDLVLLDTESDLIHQLNATAHLIWSRCDESRSVEEIAQLLVKEFDVERDVAMEDVLKTLRRLQALRLIIPA